jgi:hypothetical protein
MADKTPPYPVTPDGRYFVVRGRLWRTSNPALPRETRDRLVSRLMTARRAVKQALSEGGPALAAARAEVDGAKIALGERGPPWWTDGSPDLNRHLAANTIYRDWYAAFEGGAG